MLHLPVALFVCCSLTASLSAAADFATLKAQMASLAAPEPVALVETASPDAGVAMAPGVTMQPGAWVAFDATVIADHGPVDGLEVFACLDGGKTHESFLALRTGNGQVVKAALIAALDLHDGVVCGGEDSGIPARGTPLAVTVQWQPDRLLTPDRWVSLPASCLVRDRGSDRAYPALPYIYTGSHIRTYDQEVPGRGLVRSERFMLESTKSVIVNFDEPDALLASPFPLALRDDLFEVDSSRAPRTGSAVRLVVARCELPLTLHVDASAALFVDQQQVDDAGLAALLAEHYGAARSLPWRAVAVQVPASVADQVAVAVRERILEQAAAAGAWVVPVFTTL
ncbi:MAG: YdjY domain-containing protein [Planctomycetota bacterium]|jgi:hypothetical protein